jgi:hypothetical protein
MLLAGEIADFATITIDAKSPEETELAITT